MKLQNLATGTRQAIGFGIVIALMALVAAVAVLRLQAVHHDAEKELDLQHRAALADEWRAGVDLNVARTQAIARAPAGGELARYFEGPMVVTTERINTLLKELTAVVDDEKGKALLASIAAQRQEFSSARKDMLDRVAAKDEAGVKQLLESKLMPMSLAYTAGIQALAAHQTELVNATGAALKAKVESAQIIILALLALSAALAGGMGWLFTRVLTQRLGRTLQAATAMAGGDLTHPIVPEGSDETGRLMLALQQMQDALRKLIGDVRGGIDSMSTASTQIASGNQDLSSRTEQTASNLQQAASSLEQLTGTVRQTADSARTANQLANSASGVAQRGGEVVAQVVSTMNEINTSSRKIADIIGTIDGIAFQTNILALNAAVEAARAGEQGRGFAVVASEVRSLAQRSAAAAREIKGLIGASVERVEAGSRLVTDAGSTMGEIVASVQRVSDIIGEISAAAEEQSLGINQVNNAVAQLDQATQQNAALVEESAAAAESLKDQSRQLTAVVSTFHIDEGSFSVSSPLPAARSVATAATSTQHRPAAPKALASHAMRKAATRAAPSAATKPSVSAPNAVTRQAATKPALAAPVASAAPAKVTSPSGNADWEAF